MKPISLPALLLFFLVSCTEHTLVLKQNTDPRSYAVDALFTPDLAEIERFFMLTELSLTHLHPFSQLFRQKENELAREESEKIHRSLLVSFSENRFFSPLVPKASAEALIAGLADYTLGIFYFGQNVKNTATFRNGGPTHLSGPSPFTFLIESVVFAYQKNTKKLLFVSFVSSLGTSGLAPSLAREDAMKKNILSLLQVVSERMPQ